MKGQKKKKIFERQSSDTSWSASEAEEDLEASKASQTSSTQENLSRRVSASSRRPPNQVLERGQAAKNNNYFPAIDFTDSEEEEYAADTSGYRSPAPSRLSISDYPTEYYRNIEDDDEDYEDEDDDDEELMEIQIETLTGTIFRVRVSSRETTAGLKNLLYRTEGLPPSQQHLLLGHTELDDERTLGELGVGEGSHLRLVISLKGGPINARRNLPPEDVLWREVTDIMDERREEIWETSGGRAVTLLVLRDGDSVNLYRVLEHEDGSFSPLNQSWGSAGPLERSTHSRAGEDEKTQLTMQQLRDKMEAVKLKNKKKKKPKSSGKKRASPVKQTNRVVAKPPAPPPPRSPALKNVKPRMIKEISPDIITDVTNKPKTVNKPDSRRPKSGGTFKRTARLVHTKIARPTTQERSIELRNTSVSRTSVMMDEFSHAKPPRTIYFSGKKPLENIKPRKDQNRLGRVDEHASSTKTSPRAGAKPPANGNPNYASYRQSLVKHGKNNVQQIDSTLPGVTAEKPLKTAVPRRNIQPMPFYISTPPVKPRRDVDPLYSSHNNFDRLPLPRHFDNRPKTSPEILERRPGSTPGRGTSSSDRVMLRNPDIHLMDLMNSLNTSRARSMPTPPQTMASSIGSTTSFNQDNLMSNTNVKSNGSIATTSNNNGPSVQRRPITPLSSSFASMKFRRMSTPPSKPPSPKTSTLGSVNALTSSSNKEQTDMLRELIKSQVASTKPSSRLSTPEQAKKQRRPVSGRGHIPASPARLPPVTPTRKKRVTGGGRRPRCAQCNKRIQISTTHSCRCGQQFCAQHRYAETHSCTFDYKTEGRKLISIANPLVQPQKLPKI